MVNKTRFFKIFISVWLLFILVSCANIVPPGGGPADHTPPVLLKQEPKDSLLNQKVNKIILKFNKFVEVHDLAKNMTLSPLIEPMPEVLAKGKIIEIKIIDSLLQPNTTYRLALGNAITDNRERTPYSNFNYTFSTGSYFDSLTLHGNVRDALTNAPDTGILVALYPQSFNDSLLNLKKPTYISFTDGAGNFHFKSLPEGKFKLYAFADGDGNKLFNSESEKVGFPENLVEGNKEEDSNAVVLRIRTSLMAKRVVPKKINPDSATLLTPKYLGRVSHTAKDAKMFTVLVDTGNLSKGTFGLKDSIAIKFNSVIKVIDTPKVFLSYLNKNGIESQSGSSFWQDSLTLFLKSDWMPATHYILRLVKGWAVDTAGNELPPGKYEFKTKKLEDYSKLNIQIPDSFVQKNRILVVQSEKDTVYSKVIASKLVTLELLLPGTYNISIIADDNVNGKWDPGNIFTKTQPEMVYNNEQHVILKAGWEHQTDFKYNPKQEVINEVKKKSQRMGEQR